MVQPIQWLENERKKICGEIILIILTILIVFKYVLLFNILV